MLAAALFFIGAAPAAALDLNPGDYLQLSYDPITFDKSEVQGDEIFQVTVSGRVVCYKDLPPILPVREAEIKSQVIARHTDSGAEVTLNAEYTVNIKPFPRKAGDTIEINQAVPLQFPSQAESGNYTIIARIVKAKVKFILGSMDVTGYLPREQSMGTVKYNVPGASGVSDTAKANPENVPSSSTEPPGVTAPPSSSPAPATESTPEPEEPPTPWWVMLMIIVVIGAGIAGIALLLRHRRK